MISNWILDLIGIIRFENTSAPNLRNKIYVSQSVAIAEEIGTLLCPTKLTIVQCKVF